MNPLEIITQPKQNKAKQDVLVVNYDISNTIVLEIP